MALRYQQQQQQQLQQQYNFGTSSFRGGSSTSGGHYQLHNCQPQTQQQPTSSNNNSHQQQQRFAGAPLSFTSSSMMTNNKSVASAVGNNTSTFHHHQHHHQNAGPLWSDHQQQSRASLDPRFATVTQPTPTRTLQQLPQRSVARLAQQYQQQQQQQPISASSYNSAVNNNTQPVRNFRPQAPQVPAQAASQDPNPWISSFAYNHNQPPANFSSLKPVQQPQQQQPPPQTAMPTGRLRNGGASATATTTTTTGNVAATATKTKGSKIRSTIESLFRNGNKDHANEVTDQKQQQPQPQDGHQSQEQQQASSTNNNTNNQPASHRRKNKWRSIPGFRRSLSNLFVQQKNKGQPNDAAAPKNPSAAMMKPATIGNGMTTASIPNLLSPGDGSESCHAFVLRRELELQKRNSNTCPQSIGPLVRLRHGENGQPHPHPHQTRINSTTLSTSSGSSSTAAMTTSRQSNSIALSNGDGTSADSGYSPTEPEMILVPHPATATTSHSCHSGIYRQNPHFKPHMMSTSMYLQRCSHPSANGNGLDVDGYDLYEHNVDKSLESLSSCDHRHRGQHVSRRAGGDAPMADDDDDDDGDMADECVTDVDSAAKWTGDWPPPHMRNRTAISSPNIPRLVRRNNAASTGVQRFRPEPTDYQSQHHQQQQQQPATVDEELFDDEDDDDFCQEEDLDYLSTTQPSGSLCRLAMTSFAAQNELITGSRRQLRRPRRIRAVSDHSLHRRSRDQRVQDSREYSADTSSLHQDHPAYMGSIPASATAGNIAGSMMQPSLVKSATLGALVSGNKRNAPKILSDVPRAEFTLASSTTFFNKSESSLVDSNKQQNELQHHQQQHQQQQHQSGRPLPPPPMQSQPKQRGSIVPPGQPLPVGMSQRTSGASSGESNNNAASFVYGRPFTIPDPASTTGLTFEITPMIAPPTVNATVPASLSSSNGHLLNKQNGCKAPSILSQPAGLAPLARLNAAMAPTGVAPVHSSSTSPNSSASSTVENAPAKNNSARIDLKLNGSNTSTPCQPAAVTAAAANNNGNSSATTPTNEEGGDLQQQEQVFRRFGCQRLLEMQRRIEENCRLSERQQNEQEAVTRLLTNIRRNIRTTEI